MSCSRAAIAVLSLVLCFTHDVRADGLTTDNRARLDAGRNDLQSMRGSYAYVMRKEEAARQANDPVLLNTLHQISTRIMDLITVADHAFEDMRVAIAAGEPEESADAQLEKIHLAKSKVDKARSEADRSVGVRLLNASDGEGTARDWGSDSAALSDDDPIPATAGETTAVAPPPPPLPRNPASPATP